MLSSHQSTLLLFGLASTLIFLGACAGGGVSVTESSDSLQPAATPVTFSPTQTLSIASQSKSENTSAKQQTKLTAQSKLSINSIGPIRVGMSVAQAETAAGVKLTRPDNRGCSYIRPQGNNYDFLIMVTNNRIARIDVRGNSRITTISGARIGDMESKIKSLYPGQITVTPHKYQPKGHYLIFIPKDRNEANYRIIFETDGTRVTSFRGGKRPEVEWVEGCS
ncbi:hypothetical protein [Allocoleopsis sp.]|uniref:hypothetical protein n=1 Tax=Allocoleopsis sp. TaxID=3088169 RepID=UPI002FD074C8